MRKHISLLAAWAIALGGAGFVFAQEAQRDGVQGEVRVEQDRVVDEPVDGITGVNEREANNIRGTLSTATEAAIEGDLRSLSQRLTSSDEARLAEAFDRTDEQIEQLGRQIKDAFQARYGEDFGISDREATYPPATVQMQSGLTQEAILARGEEDGQREGEDQPIGMDQPDQARAEEDENVVTVIFSSADDKPELHVPLVNEGTIMDAWRIDVPLSVDAETIRSNLNENLNAFLQGQEQWPADINQANRKLTHVVMMSLFDKQADGEALPAGLEQLRDEVRDQADQLREQAD